MPFFRWVLVLCVVTVGPAIPAASRAGQSTKDAKMVTDGTVVSLQYTLSGEDGKTIESNKGKEALKFTQGKHQIIPGLEKALVGMKVGEEKRVKVKPEDAYGPVDKKAFHEFPKDKIPPESLKVGATIIARGPQGQAVPVRVHQIKEKTVVINLNHPMAGKTLVFDVKILDVQPGEPAAAAKPATPNPHK